MSNWLRKTILYLIPVLLTAACGTDDETTAKTDTGETAALRINVAANTTRTVTAQTGTRYDTGKQIGISAKGAETPSDYSYTNVKYTQEAPDGNQEQWTTEQEIVLRRPNATVTAYYPYREGTNPEALSIDCSDGIDWMYCPWTTETLNARWPDITLTMLHAQALLRVELRRQGYAGEGRLKFIKIETSALALTGVVNTTTGTYTTTDTEGTLLQNYIEGEELMLPADPSKVCSDEWFFLPTTFTGSVDITFTVKVDKRTLSTTTTVSADALATGRIHLYALKVMNSELEVSPVTIIPWQTVEDAHNMKPTN